MTHPTDAFVAVPPNLSLNRTPAGGLSPARRSPVSYCCVRHQRKERCVKVLSLVVVWCVLFVLSWPVALTVLVLFPLVWLIALPFRLVGICVGAMFALVKSILFLPARLLGYRG